GSRCSELEQCRGTRSARRSRPRSPSSRTLATDDGPESTATVRRASAAPGSRLIPPRPYRDVDQSNRPQQIPDHAEGHADDQDHDGEHDGPRGRYLDHGPPSNPSIPSSSP